MRRFIVRDLDFDQEPAGDFTIDAVSQGPETPRSPDNPGSNGGPEGRRQRSAARGDWPADVYFRFHRLELDPCAFESYMKAEPNGHSRADGELRLVGPLRRPRKLQLTANLDTLDAELEERE